MQAYRYREAAAPTWLKLQVDFIDGARFFAALGSAFDVRGAAVPRWGILKMSDDKPTEEVDVTKEWRATHGQKSAATRLRIFAAISWVVAIGTEIAGVVLLRQHKFDHGNLALLIGLLVVIAIFAIAGSLMWKAANKHDPARQSDKARFFFQNQLGAIITVIAFLPLHCPDLHGQGHGPEEQEDRRRHRRRAGRGARR